MHRSRIGVFLIDHPPETFDRALAFWASATASTPRRHDEFAVITPPGDGGAPELAAQRLGEGTPRMHLDIETDDIDAEVDRLEALGATVAARPEGYVIMHDPGGAVFCVVGVQSGELFDRYATSWP